MPRTVSVPTIVVARIPISSPSVRALVAAMRIRHDEFFAAVVGAIGLFNGGLAAFLVDEFDKTKTLGATNELTLCFDPG